MEFKKKSYAISSGLLTTLVMLVIDLINLANSA